MDDVGPGDEMGLREMSGMRNWIQEQPLTKLKIVAIKEF
jgi:hypothetical protein